ncbi:hypothetical protein HMI55_005706, partial [Coelomomyces lativittatus]
KRIENKLTKNQRSQKREKSKPQPSNKKKIFLKTTLKCYELFFSNNFFSLAMIHKKRDNDVFFGSRLVLKENLMSISFPHYQMYSTN